MSQTQVVRLSGFGDAKISDIIGPSKAACEKFTRLKDLSSLRKDVILPTWRMYNLAKSQGKVSGDNPKTPYIVLSRDDEGVFAEVKSDSEEMMKFVKHNLEEYQKNFKAPEKKYQYTMFACFPKDLIPRLIGKQKSSLNAIRSEAVYQVDEEVDANYLEIFSDEKKTKIWIKEFEIKEKGGKGTKGAKGAKEHDEESSEDPYDNWINFVEESNRHSMIGWAPEKEDPIIKIDLTCFGGNMDQKTFEDFTYCLSDAFDSRIKEILERNKKFEEYKKEELDTVMDILGN